MRCSPGQLLRAHCSSWTRNGNGRWSAAHRRLAVIAAAAACTVTLAGCVTPAFNTSSYRQKTQESASEMAGLVGTARLAASAYLQGKLYSATADTIVSDAENDAGDIVTQWTSVQPPTAQAENIMSKAQTLLSDTSDQLTALRIAVRKGDRQQIGSLLTKLGPAIPKLKKLAAAG